MKLLTWIEINLNYTRWKHSLFLLFSIFHSFSCFQRHLVVFHSLVEVQPKAQRLTRFTLSYTYTQSDDLWPPQVLLAARVAHSITITFAGQDLVQILMYICMCWFYLRHFPLTFYLCCAWQYSALSRWNSIDVGTGLTNCKRGRETKSLDK